MNHSQIQISQSLAQRDLHEQKLCNRDQVALGLEQNLATYGRADYTINANTMHEKRESIHFENLVEDLDDAFVSALFRFYSTSKKTNQLGHAKATRDLLALLNTRAEELASEAAAEVVK